jgi:hypothetical protein
MHVLFHGRPRLEYESLYELLKSLVDPNNSNMHWMILLVVSLPNSCACKFKIPLSRPFNLLDS